MNCVLCTHRKKFPHRCFLLFYIFVLVIERREFLWSIVSKLWNKFKAMVRQRSIIRLMALVLLVIIHCDFILVFGEGSTKVSCWNKPPFTSLLIKQQSVSFSARDHGQQTAGKWRNCPALGELGTVTCRLKCPNADRLNTTHRFSEEPLFMSPWMAAMSTVQLSSFSGPSGSWDHLVWDPSKSSVIHIFRVRLVLLEFPHDDRSLTELLSNFCTASKQSPRLCMITLRREIGNLHPAPVSDRFHYLGLPRSSFSCTKM